MGGCGPVPATSLSRRKRELFESPPSEKFATSKKLWGSPLLSLLAGKWSKIILDVWIYLMR